MGQLVEWKLELGNFHISYENSHALLQCDKSGCSPGYVDIKAKVVFRYVRSIYVLKLNFCLDLNKT